MSQPNKVDMDWIEPIIKKCQVETERVILKSIKELVLMQDYTKDDLLTLINLRLAALK